MPRHAGHGSGTLEHAEAILARYPQVAESNIHTAAILGERSRGAPLSRAAIQHSATAKGGPYEWDALTHLCFSRYLRIDQARSEDGFVRTATALLDAGASAKPAGLRRSTIPTRGPPSGERHLRRRRNRPPCRLTRLLLARGADPNDEETALPRAGRLRQHHR